MKTKFDCLVLDHLLWKLIAKDWSSFTHKNYSKILSSFPYHVSQLDLETCLFQLHIN
jgi:hypothetical protein